MNVLGELGPGTIVGSAAFNLFIIVGICVIAVEQPKRINHYVVFWVTVFWSMFAYIWLYLIIAVISPEKVEVWEGLLTFLFFPMTVLCSWAADRKMFGLFAGQRIMGVGGKKGEFSRPQTGSFR